MSSRYLSRFGAVPRGRVVMAWNSTCRSVWSVLFVRPSARMFQPRTTGRIATKFDIWGHFKQFWCRFCCEVRRQREHDGKNAFDCACIVLRELVSWKREYVCFADSDMSHLPANRLKSGHSRLSSSLITSSTGLFKRRFASYWNCIPPNGGTACIGEL
jgi:hypothetical protein